MRFPVLACMVVLVIAACDRKASDPQPSPETSPAELVIAEAPVSDALPGLPAPATGIAFWDHPTLSFNGVMIAATSEGVISYSMENGVEVARIDGFDADGVETGYLGFGPQAAGFITFLDAEKNAFNFHGIDNNTRVFIPLDAGPEVRGAVRDFCVGRAANAASPSLYVIQNDRIQTFSLTPSTSGVTFAEEAVIEAPDDLTACAVGPDGALFAAAESGAIYKVAGEQPFATPFANAAVSKAGDLSVIVTTAEDDPLSISTQIIFADLANGALHLFDASTGKALGVVKLGPTDAFSGVDGAETFAATGGNLGGLYRNGVAAFGIADGGEGPVIRLAPVSSLKNALELPVGEPVSPRGQIPTDDDTGLSIPTSYQPD